MVDIHANSIEVKNSIEELQKQLETLEHNTLPILQHISLKNGVKSAHADTADQNGHVKPEKLTQVVESITQGLGGLSAVLGQQDPNFADARELSKPIMDIKSAVGQLKLWNPGANTQLIKGDNTENGKDTVDDFAEVNALLSQGIEELEKTIGESVEFRPIALAIEDKDRSWTAASTVWNEYKALDRFNWLNKLSWGIVPAPRSFATMGHQSLTVLLVLTLGALGSLIFMTKEELRLVT